MCPQTDERPRFVARAGRQALQGRCREPSGLCSRKSVRVVCIRAWRTLPQGRAVSVSGASVRPLAWAVAVGDQPQTTPARFRRRAESVPSPRGISPPFSPLSGGRVPGLRLVTKQRKRAGILFLVGRDPLSWRLQTLVPWMADPSCARVGLRSGCANRSPLPGARTTPRPSASALFPTPTWCLPET